ncbi:S8 family serine peptidase [Actinoplanes sp. CA-030573]|uniref:S8 family serine peptidase n=1 Tax=Actinoplanes sp. CA-030573 TaxID=3239898 RepID=UPI003D8D2D17
MRRILAGLLVAGTLVVPATVAAPAAAALRPTDPGYAREWGVMRTRVNEAWSVTKGRSRVTIAIVDTGVSPLPDLAGRLRPGHDFVNDDDDPRDDNGHGTMAAGVAAAAGYNGIGIAGVCWYCRILPVKVLDAKGGGNYADIADGIRYAADQGAAIISLSLGGNDDSPLLRDAVTYADAKGALVVAAAGNQGSPQPHYPGAIPSVLSVGGVDEHDARYSWSNYGPSWVDVTAPGCNPAQQRDGSLGEYCGTSSATPFVAGIAGLLASTDPAPSAADIRTALTGGRVDALRALAALPHADHTAPTMKIYPQARFIRVRASDTSGVARLELVVNGKVTSRYAGYLHGFPIPARAKSVVIRAYDRVGNLRTALVRR